MMEAANKWRITREKTSIYNYLTATRKLKEGIEENIKIRDWFDTYELCWCFNEVCLCVTVEAPIWMTLPDPMKIRNPEKAALKVLRSLVKAVRETRKLIEEGVIDEEMLSS